MPLKNKELPQSACAINSNEPRKLAQEATTLSRCFVTNTKNSCSMGDLNSVATLFFVLVVYSVLRHKMPWNPNDATLDFMAS